MLGLASLARVFRLYVPRSSFAPTGDLPSEAGCIGSASYDPRKTSSLSSKKPQSKRSSQGFDPANERCNSFKEPSLSPDHAEAYVIVQIPSSIYERPGECSLEPDRLLSQTASCLEVPVEVAGNHSNGQYDIGGPTAYHVDGNHSALDGEEALNKTSCEENPSNRAPTTTASRAAPYGPSTVSSSLVPVQNTARMSDSASTLKGPTHKEPYQKATYIVEVLGNHHQGTIEEGAFYEQETEGIPSISEYPRPIVDLRIPVDELGRAHNVIGRVIGNSNAATIPRTAHFKQTFRAGVVRRTNYMAHEMVMTRVQDPLLGEGGSGLC